MATRIAMDWDDLEIAMAEMRAAGHSPVWIRALETAKAVRRLTGTPVELLASDADHLSKRGPSMMIAASDAVKTYPANR